MELLSESKKRRITLIKKLLSEGYSFSKIDKNRDYKKEGWGDSLVFVKDNSQYFENITFRRNKNGSIRKRCFKKSSKIF